MEGVKLPFMYFKKTHPKENWDTATIFATTDLPLIVVCTSNIIVSLEVDYQNDNKTK